MERWTMKNDRSRALELTAEDIGERVIALLLIVEAVSVFLLWTLDSLTIQGQNTFALFLGVNFIAFAMMSYLYRTLSSGEEISRVLMIAGCLVIAILPFLSFAFWT
jgi:hypothetical protein